MFVTSFLIFLCLGASSGLGDDEKYSSDALLYLFFFVWFLDKYINTSTLALQKKVKIQGPLTKTLGFVLVEARALSCEHSGSFLG